MATAVLINVASDGCDNVKEDLTKYLSDHDKRIFYIYILPAPSAVNGSQKATSYLKDVFVNAWLAGSPDKEQNIADVTILSANDDVTNFYHSKQSIDELGIIEIKLICPNSKILFWSRICRLLLTSVYSWSIGVDSCEEIMFDSDSELTASVKRFLISLPSFGSVGIMYSSLIPRGMFRHGFHTRNGGISQIPGMKSMNVIYSDNKRDPFVVVEENRRRLAVAAGYDPSRFHIGRAVHDKTVWVLGKAKPSHGSDSMITNKPGEVIAAPGADCIVMVFADPQKLCCGVCHAGWMGSVKGVAMETVRALMREYGSSVDDILVVMGPSVNSCCFTLDDESAKQIHELEPSCVIRRGNCSKNYIDLQSLNQKLLVAGGVLPEHIDNESLTVCTSCNDSRFFSFNRDGIPFGNQIGFIHIKETGSGN